MRWCGKPVAKTTPVIKVRCISRSYSNFEYNKIYEAEARGKRGTLYTDYKITDEGGEFFTIMEQDLGKLFLLIPEVNIKKH